MLIKVETDEVYEYIWAKSFDKLYSNMINSSTPLQVIALGCAHTIGLNSKGKVYGFGWNNYGQCGIPINCMILLI
jgi:alpha-tubulin suppressor-like RCC1 family protein